MVDFFEVDEKKKTVKTLNLEDLSIEDLNKYTYELKEEISRVQLELRKKNKFLKDADKFFK